MDKTLLEKALELTKNSKFLEAEKIYTDMLEAEPEDYILLSAVGLFYISQRNFNKASYYLEKSCNINETAGNVTAYGISEFERKNFKNSAIILERALEFIQTEEIYQKLIISFFSINHFQKALYYANQMCEKFPDNKDAINYKIKALIRTGELREAERICVELLKTNRDNSVLWIQLGFLKELLYCDDNQACECFKIATELGNRNGLYNLAVSYVKQGNYKEAENYYKKMLEIIPNHNDTLVSLGMCYLKQKRFEEGYKLLSLREKTPIELRFNNFYDYKTPLEKEIQVFGDQGFGDNIMFSRYLPELQKSGKKFTVITRPQLCQLFKSSFNEFNFITLENANPDIQTVRLSELPFILNLDFDNIPSSSGYLRAEKKVIESDKIKVGLCWEAGSAGIRTMLGRTINIKLFEPFFEKSNIQVYSFQVNDSMNGNNRYPQMINLAKEFEDFNDTAKALMAMDVVITVDTALAHLSGALGKKTYLLLPYASDWRWFEDDKTTPWYDSVKIFKQTKASDWKNVLEEILQDF